MKAIVQIFILFSLIFVGVVVGKRKMVSDNFKSDISRLLLGIFLPALILKSMSFEFSKEMFYSSIKIIGISFMVYAMSIVISRLFTRILKTEGDRKNVFEYSLVFSNSGFMGYPVLSVIYGDKALFYAVMFNLGFTFMVWTYGVYIYERENRVEGEKSSLSANLKNMLNPGIISMVVGFLMFSFNLSYPTPVFRIIELLGGLTTPLSMIFIGLILSETKISELLTDKLITLVSFFRLIVLPAIVFAVLYLMGVDGLILYVAVVITAMPVAANTAIFAERHGSDYRLASLVIFQSTAFSIATVPILILLLSYIILY